MMIFFESFYILSHIRQDFNMLASDIRSRIHHYHKFFRISSYHCKIMWSFCRRRGGTLWELPKKLTKYLCVSALLLYMRSGAVIVCAFRRSYCMCFPTQLLYVHSGAFIVSAFRRSYCMCVPAQLLYVHSGSTVTICAFRHSYRMCVQAQLLYVRSRAFTVCAFWHSYCMCVPAAQLLYVRSGAVTVCSVADPDPGSGIGAFLTPGSRIPDPKLIFLRA